MTQDTHTSANSKPRERNLKIPNRWRGAFNKMASRLEQYFPRTEVRSTARAYIAALLTPIERKNGWQLAEAIGDENPYALQHLLGRASWSADQLRDELRSYIVDTLGSKTGILILDETNFPKKGDKSAGVQLQYNSVLGHMENSQTGVFLAYSTPQGCVLIDRQLFLPESWTEDRARCDQAGIPGEVGFTSKAVIGRKMLTAVLDAEVPCAWVIVGDENGSDTATRKLLETRSQPYILAVAGGQQVRFEGSTTVKKIAASLPSQAWQRLRSDGNTKGARREWALQSFQEQGVSDLQPGVLFSRDIDDPAEISYYLVLTPPKTTLSNLVRTLSRRSDVEEAFESAKTEIGLNQYEVRSWVGWHRHVTLALWAHTFLTIQRSDSSKKKLPKVGKPWPSG